MRGNKQIFPRLLAFIITAAAQLSPLDVEPLHMADKAGIPSSFKYSSPIGSSSSPSSRSTRRLSAAGQASFLKAGNLIPPLNSPTDRRISLPRTAKSSTAANLPTNPEPSVMPADRVPQPPNPGLLEQIEALIKGVRDDIAKSESKVTTKLDSKIDDLTTKLSNRMEKAEGELTTLGIQVAQTRSDMEDVRAEITDRDRRLPRLVEELLEKRLANRTASQPRSRGPRPRPSSVATGSNAVELPTPSDRPDTNSHEEKYWRARRSLRMWPVPGPKPELSDAVLKFAQDRLLLPADSLEPEDFEVKRVPSVPNYDAQDQVVVTFVSVELRDSIKALGKNLRGSDRKTGIQIEPPDHLRGHFQSFQRLAYQMKKKFPTLKRNVKFYDPEQTLSMDVLTRPDSSWRTILYDDAKTILARTRERTDSVSVAELEDMCDMGPGGPRKRRRETILSSESSDNDDTIIDLTDSEKEKNTSCKPSCVSLSFINSNARSLRPKLQSLDDCFQEKRLDFATLTETWFQDGRDFEIMKADLTDKYGLGILARNRDRAASNGRLYGGVAFLYRKSRGSFKEFVLQNPDEHEILACVGSLKGIKGKVFTISCYAPPNITPLKAKQMIEFLSDVIGEAKRRFENCTLVISGDFNQWQLDEVLEDHPDLSEIPYGATRAGRAIDRTLVNFGRSVDESGTLPPLETEEGLPSDHRIAWALAKFESQPKNTITYSYRAYTEAGANAFIDSIGQQSWDAVFSEPTSSDKVRVFQDIVESHLSRHFEMRTTTRRESDPPWINDRVRKLWSKRRKIYDKQGRSAAWKKLKKKSDKLVRKRASNYFERQKASLLAPDAAKSFHKHVKAYKSREKASCFDIRDLYQGRTDEQVAEDLADHFNSISSEFDGLNAEEIPQSHSYSLPVLSVEDVRKRLISIRKPKSTVKGDIFPSLINRAATVLSVPLANIYNCITSTSEWPSIWKIEYVTPIPKKTLPESPDDLRNISCTQLLSKVYESFVLEWLGSQIDIRTNQFGGIKGSGSEHCLVLLWQQVLENIEDQRASSLLTSIDYSKAFNRLDFNTCLRAMKAKGASSEVLNIKASFLTGRVMRVKVGDKLSAPRQVMGGVPQGSLLGVLLFNLSIDDFEAFSPDVKQYNPRDLYTLTDQAPNPPAPMPVPLEGTGRDYRHLPPWTVELLQVLKYVDDNVINEKIRFDNVPTNGHGFREKRAIRTENLFRLITHQAISQGMKVNGAKTKSLLISELKNYIPKAFVLDGEGNTIKSGNEMKILGFNFSSDPDMSD